MVVVFLFQNQIYGGEIGLLCFRCIYFISSPLWLLASILCQLLMFTSLWVFISPPKLCSLHFLQRFRKIFKDWLSFCTEVRPTLPELFPLLRARNWQFGLLCIQDHKRLEIIILFLSSLCLRTFWKTFITASAFETLTIKYK